MNGLNKVQFIGNLGQDPNIVAFENGGKKAEFSIATQDGYKDANGNWQKTTDWHRCYASGKLADTMEKYFTKGMRVYVDGKLKTRSWQDQQGNTKYITEVRVTDFMFLNSKGESVQGQTQPEILTQETKDEDLPF